MSDLERFCPGGDTVGHGYAEMTCAQILTVNQHR